MLPVDLINVAKALVNHSAKRPKQAELRRAVSSVYYAMFHAVARNCADSLIGSASRESGEWNRVYRALEHGAAKQQCQKASKTGSSAGLRDFAAHFAHMQSKRHSADYDPASRFAKSEVSADLESALKAIADFQRLPAEERRAFAAFVLFKDRAA